MRTAAFDRLAGVAAFAVAVGGVVYAALFVVIAEGGPGWTRKLWFAALMLGGLAMVPVIVAMYFRLREIDWGIALTALLLGLGGAFGGVVHGAYELAALVSPPASGYYPGPESVSKGVMRYAMAGLSLLIVAWLLRRGGAFPRVVSQAAFLGGALLLVIYVGRLLDIIRPDSYASLVPVIAYGFAVHPACYFLVGRELLRGAVTASAPSPGPVAAGAAS